MISGNAQTVGLPRTGYALLALAAFFWGMYGPVSRGLFELGFNAHEIAFLRCAVGCACFSLHALCTKNLRVRPADAPRLVLFGMIGLGLLNISYQVAVHESGAAFAVVLLYTAPAWVALMSALLFKHRLGRRCLFAMGTAMLGVALVSLAGDTDGRLSLLGASTALASGFFYALHFPWNFKWRGTYSPITLYAWAMLGGALLLAPFADLSRHSPLAWLQTLAGLVVVTYLPYLCYGLGMRSVNPAPAAVIVNLEPVIGCAAAFLWWNERFSPPGWLGAVLVIAAVFVLVTDRGKKSAGDC